MTEDLAYRLTILAVLLAVVPIGVYHRLRAAASGENISHAEEGYVFAAALRLGGLGMWLALLAYLLYPPATRWSALPLSSEVRWLGAPLGFASAGLMAWTLRSLGRNLTDTVVTRASAELVTQGPYHWVRHPFYVSAGLLITAVTLLSASGILFAAGVFTMTLLVIRTTQEEALLAARFGEPYLRYAARTGRFFPWMRSRE